MGTLFYELGVELVYSKATDKEILEVGKTYAIDETCLSLKTYLGHIAYLVDKVDYILVPRIVSLKSMINYVLIFMPYMIS